MGAASIGPPGELSADDDALVVSPAPEPPARALLALPALLTAALCLLLLWLGGPAAGFGAWLLATAFPIVLGAVTRHAGYAAVPALLWTGWLLFVEFSPPDADLTRTPLPLALTLAAVGVGATLLAQRAIAPALERAAWLPPQPRLAPSVDEALAHEPQVEVDGVEVDEQLGAALDEDGPIDDELLSGSATAHLDEDDAAEHEDAADDGAEPDAEAADDEGDDDDDQAPAAEAADDADEDGEPVADAADDEAEPAEDDDVAEDEDDAPAPPLPAATEAGRRGAGA